MLITVTVYVKVDTDARRLARAGEATVEMNKRGWLSWDEPWIKPTPTDANGQVGWYASPWPGDRYRLVAKHLASGAEVRKIFEVEGDAVTKEEPQAQVAPGKEMAPWFSEELSQYTYSPELTISVKRAVGYFAWVGLPDGDEIAPGIFLRFVEYRYAARLPPEPLAMYGPFRYTRPVVFNELRGVYWVLGAFQVRFSLFNSTTSQQLVKYRLSYRADGKAYQGDWHMLIVGPGLTAECEWIDLNLEKNYEFNIQFWVPELQEEPPPEFPEVPEEALGRLALPLLVGLVGAGLLALVMTKKK